MPEDTTTTVIEPIQIGKYLVLPIAGGEDTVATIEEPVEGVQETLEEVVQIDPETRAAVLKSLKPEDLDLVDDSVKDGWFGSAKHDSLKKLPNYNKYIQRFIQETKQKTQAEFRQRQDQDSQMAAMDSQFRELEVNGQLSQVLTDPRYYQAYGALQNWRREKSGQVVNDPITMARNTAMNLYGLLQQDPDYHDFDFEAFANQANDPAQVIYALATHKAKAATGKAQTKVRAEANEFVAKSLEGSDTPDRTDQVGYGGPGRTFAQIEQDYIDGKIGRKEYATARAKHGIT